MVLIMGIGERLKEARTEKGISLDTLQEQTKIQKRYLIAIEEENFDILPGTFYARAFIKEYAQTVGLDADEIIAEYEGEIPSPEKEESVNNTQYTRVQQSRRDQSGRNRAIFSFIPTVIVVLLVVGIIALAWIFIVQKPSTNEEVAEQDVDENTVIRNAEDENDEEEDAEKKDAEKTGDDEGEEAEADDSEEEESVDEELVLVEEGTGDRPESTFDLNNASEKVKIEFETEGETWLDVEDEDGNSLHSSMFTADQSPLELDLSDAERVYLNIGHAPNLQVKINGTKLEYPVDPNEKVLQRIWINIKKESE